MMDPARAAPVLNLDAKPPAKSAAGGDKVDAGDKKAMFRETLNRHSPSKNLQSDSQDKAEGDALLDGATDDEGVPEGAQQGDNASAAAVAARLKKPVIPLGQALRLKGANDDASGDEIASRIDIRTMGLHKSKSKDQADMVDPESSQPDSYDIDLSKIAMVLQKIQGGQQIDPSDAADAKKAAEDSDGEAVVKDEPAKDVLSLLHENARNANAGAMHAQSASAAMNASADHGHGDSAQDQGGTVYRLSRADGKGGALDIPGSDQPMPEEASAKETTINPVSVVDQRRFLAPAQDNALAVVSTIGGNPEWSSAMQPESSLANAASVAGNGKVVNTLKIQMHPIDLGLVTATMRLAGEELTVELKVENGTAYRQLKEDQSRIIDALRAQGFSVDQVTVVMAPERSDSGNGQSNTAQNGQGGNLAQQNQARGGAQGQAPGRGNGGYQQENERNGNSQADEGRSDVGAVGSRGVAGTGNLYL